MSLLTVNFGNANTTSTDVISQVIEYLSKKGYSKTESMLRQESANQDVEGRPLNAKAEETGGAKYGKAFGACPVLFYAPEHPTELQFLQGLMRSWIEECLDIYKVRLQAWSASHPLTVS